MHLGRMHRVLTGAVMALAVVTAPLVVAPSPASAATGTKCAGWQDKTLAGPGKPAAAIVVQVCIRSDYLGSGLYGRTSWFTVNGFSDDKIITKFNQLAVTVRMEHNDVIGVTKSCDLTVWGNNLKAYANESTQKQCVTSQWNSGTVGGWTTDGYVRYDYEGDGKGDYLWQLGGSPSVS
jgi:hypothetical protein